jgi:hypothetical protein
MIRSMLGLVCGIITAMMVIFAFQKIGAVFYPMAQGADLTDPEALRQVMAAMPVGAFVTLLAGYAVGTFIGAWVAASIAGRAAIAHALIVGCFFFLANIANVIMIPHPLWYVAASMLLFLPCAYLGGRLARRPA